MDQNSYDELNTYELTHLISHLKECDYFSDIHYILGEDNGKDWFEKKIQKNLFDSYIQDIRLGISVSFQEAQNYLANNIGINRMPMLFKYGLILSSIISSTSVYVSPKVAALLVKRGIWSLERGITYFSFQDDYQTRAFLTELMANQQFINQSNFLDTLVTHTEKIRAYGDKLSFIVEISHFTDDIRISNLKTQAVSEFTKNELKDVYLKPPNEETISNISLLMKLSNHDTRKWLFENLLQSILNSTLTNQRELLFELFPLTQDDKEADRLCRVYLDTIGDEEDTSKRAEEYLRILPIVSDQDKRTDIVNKLLEMLTRSRNIGEGLSDIGIQLIPFLSSIQLLDFAPLAIGIKKHPNQKAETIAFIAKQLSVLGNLLAIERLKEFIYEKFNDPCLRAISLSGFRDKLSQSEKNKIIEDIFQYPYTKDFSKDAYARIILETALPYAIHVFDNESFQKFIPWVLDNNINIFWGTVISEATSLESEIFSEILLEYFLIYPNASEKVLYLLDLIEHVSEESRKKAFNEILLTIPLIDEMQKTHYYEETVLLGDKYGIHTIDMSEMAINDIEEIAHCIAVLNIDQKRASGINPVIFRKLIEKINSVPIGYSKAKALSSLAYFLNVVKPSAAEKNLAFIGAVDCSHEIGNYHEIKTLLRLMSSIHESQKLSFYNNIQDRVVELHRTKGIIKNETATLKSRESQIYTDMALMAAELGNFDLSLILASLITRLPEVALFVKRLEKTPEYFTRKVFELAINSLDRGFDIPFQKDFLVEDALIEVLFLLPCLPDDLIIEIENRIDKLDHYQRLDVINMLIPFVSQKTLDDYIYYCRKNCNEYQIVDVFTNLISTYIKMGQIDKASELLKELINNPRYYIKNALEILSVVSDEKIEANVISVFSELVSDLFLPHQKRIFFQYNKVTLNVIREYASLLKLGYKSRFFYNDIHLEYFHIARKICDINISDKDKEEIVNECLSYVGSKQGGLSYDLDVERIYINSINAPAPLDEITYKRANQIKILESIVVSLPLEARLRILEGYFGSFIEQPRNTMLIELSVLFPMFNPCEELKLEITNHILQVCSWWE